MRSIRLILGVIASASLLFSVNANAQENNNRDENGNVVRGAYETNGFWDNWFIGGGAGVNTFFGHGVDGKFALSADGFIGKWFTPCVGARVGYKGLGLNTAIQNGWEFMTTAEGKLGMASANLDVLWNISNSISGYKETRFWDFVPYFRAGYIQTKGGDYKPAYDKGTYCNREWGLGLGLLNDFRLGNRLDLYIDATGLVVKNGMPSQHKTPIARNVKSEVWALLPSVTAGIILNLGRTGFDRHSSITPTVIPVPFTLEQYNALQDQVNLLAKENGSLKDQINTLGTKAAKLDALKNGQLYVYDNGKFVEAVETVTTPSIVYFDKGSAKISDREMAHIEFYAKNALENDADILLLVGSASRQEGTHEFNQKLSERRADAVKKALVEKFGISADRISTLAEGDTNNVYDTPEKNRSVTIKIK